MCLFIKESLILFCVVVVYADIKDTINYQCFHNLLYLFIESGPNLLFQTN